MVIKYKCEFSVWRIEKRGFVLESNLSINIMKVFGRARIGLCLRYKYEILKIEKYIFEF